MMKGLNFKKKQWREVLLFLSLFMEELIIVKYDQVQITCQDLLKKYFCDLPSLFYNSKNSYIIITVIIILDVIHWANCKA